MCPAPSSKCPPQPDPNREPRTKYSCADLPPRSVGTPSANVSIVKRAIDDVELLGHPSGAQLGLCSGLAIAMWLYLIWLPVSSNGRLLLLFVLLGTIALLGRVRPTGTQGLCRPFATLIALQYTFGIFGVLIGAINNAPGIITQTVLYLVVPAVFWLCVNAIDERMLARILRVGGWATAILASLIIGYYLQTHGHIPKAIPSVLLRQQQTFAAGEKLRFIGLESLLILGPLYTTSLLFPFGRDWMPGLPLRASATASAITAVLLSGRQAFIILEVTSPLVAVVVARIFRVGVRRTSDTTRRRMRAGSAPLLALILAGLALAFASGALRLDTATKSFVAVPRTIIGAPVSPETGNVYTTSDNDTLSSPDILRVETPQLIRGWTSVPVEGAGFGATLPGYARNLAKPWNFEAQYALLLFQTGIIGAALLVILLCKGWRILRTAALVDRDLQPVIVVTTTTAICVLIANAVDPYLQAPGVCWGLYLPFAAANLALRRSSSQLPDQAIVHLVATDDTR